MNLVLIKQDLYEMKINFKNDYSNDEAVDYLKSQNFDRY